MEEKFIRGFCLGFVKAWVSFDISSARIMPSVEMIRAVVFVMRGIVVGRGFAGRI